jgi:hypothetical protein
MVAQLTLLKAQVHVCWYIYIIISYTHIYIYTHSWIHLFWIYIGPTVDFGSNTEAVFRIESGCTDTDDNKSNFASSVAAPRNRATAFSVCTVPKNAPIVSICPTKFSAIVGKNNSVYLNASDSNGLVNMAKVFIYLYVYVYIIRRILYPIIIPIFNMSIFFSLM